MTPDIPIDARTPMCERVLKNIRACEVAYHTRPSFYAVPATYLGIMLLEMELRSGTRHAALAIDGVPIVAIEMHPEYERGEEGLQ